MSLLYGESINETTVFSRAQQQEFFNMLPLSDSQKLQMTRELQRESWDKERGYDADGEDGKMKDDDGRPAKKKKRARGS